MKRPDLRTGGQSRQAHTGKATGSETNQVEDRTADRNRSRHQIRDAPGLQAGRMDDERNAQDLVVERIDVQAGSVIEEFFSVIRQHDHDGAIEQGQPIEFGE